MSKTRRIRKLKAVNEGLYERLANQAAEISQLKIDLYKERVAHRVSRLPAVQVD